MTLIRPPVRHGLQPGLSNPHLARERRAALHFGSQSLRFATNSTRFVAPTVRQRKPVSIAGYACPASVGVLDAQCWLPLSIRPPDRRENPVAWMSVPLRGQVARHGCSTGRFPRRAPKNRGKSAQADSIWPIPIALWRRHSSDFPQAAFAPANESGPAAHAPEYAYQD